MHETTPFPSAAKDADAINTTFALAVRSSIGAPRKTSSVLLKRPHLQSSSRCQDIYSFSLQDAAHSGANSRGTAAKLAEGHNEVAIGRANCAAYRLWSLCRQELRARAFSLRSPIGRHSVRMLFGRRAETLERSSTSLFIGTEVPDKRGVL